MCIDSKGNEVESDRSAWWLLDGQRIPLCKVCEVCERRHRARYRPEILRPYTEADVDEAIEADE